MAGQASFILCAGTVSGRVDMYGPFPSEKRAQEYALSFQSEQQYKNFFVKPLTVPFSVVKNIIWR